MHERTVWSALAWQVLRASFLLLSSPPVFVPLSHTHAHSAVSCPGSAEYLQQAGVITCCRLWGGDCPLHVYYPCIDRLLWPHQVELTLQWKMCNGMIESISKASLAHTSATKQSFLLLLGLTVVSTAHGAGKTHDLWLHSHTVQRFMG